MIPQRTPTNSRSAARAISTRSRGGMPRLHTLSSANAVPTQIDADDDRPAPTGRLPPKSTSAPRGPKRSKKSRSTPIG
jgi:hypothetical protein